MSATKLSTLAAHIEAHDLPYHNITTGHLTARISVQLVKESVDELARWASTLIDVTWQIQDIRDGEKAAGWYVYMLASLDGDMTVWDRVPSDLADTAAEVEQILRDRVAALAADPVPAVSEQEAELLRRHGGPDFTMDALKRLKELEFERVQLCLELRDAALTAEEATHDA